jgi:pimeloyl-ACP methyl ester carboxylesterase
MQKPILIILPGWGGTKRSWKEFIEYASKDMQVHCLELPCFGDEPCPKEVWGIEEYAQYVRDRIVQIANGEKVALLGHSFGGQVAAVVAAKNPELLSHLILSGASIYRSPRSVKRTAFGICAKVGKILFALPGLRKGRKIAQKILYKVADSPDYLQTSGIERKIFQRITRQDVSEYLPRIQAKTLVVWGEKDVYVPLKHGKMVAENISGSALEIFPQGRHGLHLCCKEELAKVIQDFSN